MRWYIYSVYLATVSAEFDINTFYYDYSQLKLIVMYAVGVYYKNDKEDNYGIVALCAQKTFQIINPSFSSLNIHPEILKSIQHIYAHLIIIFNK